MRRPARFGDEPDVIPMPDLAENQSSIDAGGLTYRIFRFLKTPQEIYFSENPEEFIKDPMKAARDAIGGAKRKSSR